VDVIVRIRFRCNRRCKISVGYIGFSGGGEGEENRANEHLLFSAEIKGFSVQHKTLARQTFCGGRSDLPLFHADLCVVAADLSEIPPDLFKIRPDLSEILPDLSEISPDLWDISPDR